MSIVWFFVLQGCGILISNRICAGHRSTVRLWLGSVLGSLMAIWSPIPFAFLCGFTLSAHLFGLIACVLLTCGICLWKRKPILEPYGETGTDLPLAGLLAGGLILVTVILLNHTIPEGENGLYTGQCTYGDMAMHLGFVTSIAEQGTFPPYYSILPSAKLCYPFLCDSISASFYLLGMPLRWAYMIPMFFAFTQVFCGGWYLAKEICADTKSSVLAWLFFFLCGGFGTVYFLNGSYSFRDIFVSFYKTPTNLTDKGIRWVNIIVDMLIPQRATLFGWSILFAVLWLLYRAVFEDEQRFWLPAGLMGGLLPMIHTHSYFALGLTALGWMICTGIRQKGPLQWLGRWCMFGIPAVLLALPQLLEWTLQSVGGNSSFLRLSVDWVNHGQENFFLFWLKNVGPLFLIIPLAFVFTDRRHREISSGAVLIFVLGELVLFQPNPYDNNKIFYISYLFFCFLSADAVMTILRKMRNTPLRYAAGTILLVLCTNAAVLSLAREVISGTEPYRYLLIGKGEAAACEFIQSHTEPDSVFLTADNHDNAVAILTGRNIVCGSTSYVYYHGLDYTDALQKEKEMLRSPEAFEQYRKAFDIDYVYLSSHELSVSHDLADYLAQRYSCIYREGNVQIYSMKTIA